MGVAFADPLADATVAPRRSTTLTRHGKRPEVMIDPRIEQQIDRYLAETRQVLV